MPVLPQTLEMDRHLTLVVVMDKVMDKDKDKEMDKEMDKVMVERIHLNRAPVMLMKM